MKDWLLSFMAAASLIGLTIWTVKIMIEVLK
ncbi:hypothetical protein [Caudoviricetes sp.]|nr:hypothetical protein [Caudoviricetes sp.]